LTLGVRLLTPDGEGGVLLELQLEDVQVCFHNLSSRLLPTFAGGRTFTTA